MDNDDQVGSNQVFATQAYQPQPTGPLKQSGLGIASFIWGIVNGVLMFILFAVAGVVTLQQPELEAVGLVNMLVGLFIIAGLGACLIAAIMGVGALFQENRSKVFAVLGILLNLFVLLGTVLLLLVGFSMQA